MERFKAIINVGLKPTIKDIKAITLTDAVSEINEGKNYKCSSLSTYTIEFDAENKQQAQIAAQKIAEDILSNGVIEQYRIEWENPYV